MTRHAMHGHEVLGESEVRRLLSRCWGGAGVTTPAVAALARLEEDPLPVLGQRGGQLVVDAEAVTTWAAGVLEERPFLVEQAQRAMRGDWHLAVRAGGVDAAPAAPAPATAATEAEGGSLPSPSPQSQIAEPTTAARSSASAARGPIERKPDSRWLRGWAEILAFVTQYEPFEERALRWWARHPRNPIPVTWKGGRLVGGKQIGARVFAERAKVLAWVRLRQRTAARRVAAA